MKTENYFTILTLSIYTVKKNWAESQKGSRMYSQNKAQFTILGCDLVLMSRHRFPLFALVQLRPCCFSYDLVASAATIFLATAWINGRDIVYGRDLVSSVFLKS